MIAAAILTTTFLAGAFTGLLVLLRLATIREQRKPFSIQAHTPVTAASRAFTGLYVRRAQPVTPAGYVTARLVPGQARPRAAVPDGDLPLTGGTVLPAIRNPVMNPAETDARSCDRRTR